MALNVRKTKTISHYRTEIFLGRRVWFLLKDTDIERKCVSTVLDSKWSYQQHFDQVTKLQGIFLTTIRINQPEHDKNEEKINQKLTKKLTRE